MNDFMFDVEELVAVLGITLEEASYLISGDAMIEKDELEKLAIYTGLTYDEICDVFNIVI